MKSRTTLFLLAAFALGSLPIAGNLMAADEGVKLTASVEPAEVQPGAIFGYSITIEGAQPDEVPPIQLPQGLTVLTPRPTLQSESVYTNGVTRSIMVFTWRISAQEKGEFVIPAQEIHIRGTPQRTNEAHVVVKENPEHNASQFDPLITMEVEKREVYVGEVTPITVNIYVRPRVSQVRRWGLIEIAKDNFAIQRFPQQAEETPVMMGDIPYRALAFHSTMSALRPGKFKLGPASMDIILDVQTASGGPGQPFFPQFDTRNVKIQGNEIEITVLPLPKEGRPANFSGAVGEYNITAAADPVELQVGDPISVDFTFTGSGNFDALSAPSLSGDAANWRAYPARRTNLGPPDPRGESIQQTATFNQVFIPKQVVTELPPFEFSYFSPSQKKYVTARTSPVRLKVSPGERRPEAGPAAKTGTSAGPAAEPDKVPQPLVRSTDILTAMPESSAWIAPRPLPWRDRGFLIANAIALGALVVLLAGKGAAALLRTRAAGPAAPVRKLWRTLQKARLDRGEFYAAAAHYISLHPSAEHDLAKVVARHHELNFGPASKEARDPLPSSERSEVLSQIRSHCPHDS